MRPSAPRAPEPSFEKVTFVRLLGVAGAQSLAAELLGFAVGSLAPLGRKADPLRELAHFVQHRSR